MSALAATIPSRLGTLSPGAPVAATDTVAAALLGAKGAIVEVLNAGASPDAITITDAGSTPAGTPGGTIAGSVTNATNKSFFIHPSQADPVTGLVTITHTLTVGVTYKLYKLG